MVSAKADFLLQAVGREKRSIARNAQTLSVLFSKVPERSKNLIHVPFEIARLILENERACGTRNGMYSYVSYYSTHLSRNSSVSHNFWKVSRSRYCLLSTTLSAMIHVPCQRSIPDPCPRRKTMNATSNHHARARDDDAAINIDVEYELLLRRRRGGPPAERILPDPVRSGGPPPAPQNDDLPPFPKNADLVLDESNAEASATIHLLRPG